MKDGDPSNPKNARTIVRVPVYEDLVWVQCKGYRCMAYLDASGKWINFYTGEKLTDFVKVIG
jgi:hypothetical protein